MTTLTAPWASTLSSGIAMSSTPASRSSSPPQNGRLRRQPRNARQALTTRARTSSGLLAEGARRAGDPGNLVQGARVLADHDVVERRVARQVVGVDDEVARPGRG